MPTVYENSPKYSDPETCSVYRATADCTGPCLQVFLYDQEASFKYDITIIPPPAEERGKLKPAGRLARKVSPITHVSADDPPTLIIPGDADKLLPIEQAETFVAKLKEAGVPAELVVKHGAGHGWFSLEKDMNTLADWFDKYLKKSG